MIYNLYGLKIKTNLELPAVQPSVGPADISVAVHDIRPHKLIRPNGRVVAELIDENGPRYTFCELGDGDYIGRYYSIGDFEYSPQNGVINVYPHAREAMQYLHLTLMGALPAFVLMVQNLYVLHASCVEIDGKAVAFAGPSNIGKSTVAASVCAAGARLVTDDVLPVETESGTTFARLGAPEIRLRPTAEALLTQFDDVALAGMTADARHAVRPQRITTSRIALGAIVLPRPQREIEKICIEPLSNAEAIVQLGRAQRIEGWVRPHDVSRLFRLAGDIVATTPVIIMNIPWGIERFALMGSRIIECLSDSRIEAVH